MVSIHPSLSHSYLHHKVVTLNTFIRHICFLCHIFKDVRYVVPQKLGILKVLQSPSDFTINNVISRIQKNSEKFQAKFERKMKLENEFYEEKYSKPKA